MFVECVFNLVNQFRQISLALGHCKCTCRQCHTRHGSQTHPRVLAVVNVKLLQQRRNFRKLGRMDIANYEVLVGGQTEVARMHLGNLLHPSFKHVFSLIPHTPVLNKDAVRKVAVVCLVPTEAVAVLSEFEGPLRSELESRASLDLGAVLIDSHILNGVLETRMLAVGSITKVSLHQHDLLSHFKGLFHRHKTKYVRKAGVGLCVAVSHAHATASSDIEAKEFTIDHHRNVPKTVGENVDIVQWRDCNCHLELTREVRWAVQWLDFSRSVPSNHLFVKPDLMVS
mmetsp:Transcript_15739/g.40733  ORF Transcript_15739/g.40733 Transcript_15739/m.40733 type:complete len:284 (+) Transcript_15739:476-1327(+)